MTKFKLLWITSLLSIPLSIIFEVFQYLGLVTSILALYIITTITLKELNNG